MAPLSGSAPSAGAPRPRSHHPTTMPQPNAASICQPPAAMAVAPAASKTSALSSPLPDWIQRARGALSHEVYMECAVAVALELTKRLCDVLGTNASGDFNGGFNCNWSLSSLNETVGCISTDFLKATSEEHKAGADGNLSPSILVARIEDVLTENVAVSVATSDNGSAQGTAPANLVPTHVDLQPAESKPSDVFEAPQLSSRDVCFALGKILFELFSQGDPLLLLELEMDGIVDDGDDSFGDLNLLLERVELEMEEEEATAPSPKRSVPASIVTSVAAPPTKCMKAKAYLQARGVPMSICQLVCDLLEAEEGNAYIPDTALLSLEEAQFDLTRMKEQPKRFLHDRTCPKMALESAALFNQSDGELYGRETEMALLMEKAAQVSLHVNGLPQALQMDDFLCEAVFLSGHSGSGKSSITKQLVSHCSTSDWSLLVCKFDRQVAPLSALVQAFDRFFAKFILVQGDDGQYLQREPSVQAVFDRISESIISSIDSESFGQLCQLLPSLCQLFPMSVHYLNETSASIPSTGEVGAGSNRLHYLFHIIFKAVCSGGNPVAIVLEDLQWSDMFTFGMIADLIQAAGYSPNISTADKSSQGGLLLVGNFRGNEVDDNGFLMNRINSLAQPAGNINVSMLNIGELKEHQVNQMLSFKLCLPTRYTRELAQLIHHKTRGLPLYLMEFLRSIIQRDLVQFSVKSRRWTWDDTAIDMQMMSDGVVELLTRNLQQLPREVIDALKVVSCIGQVNVSTIELLDLGQFVPNMLEALGVAMKEGVLERAGPIFAFSHDMLQESTYNFIAADERKLLHKKIAKSLLQEPGIADNAELCTLAADQINMCKDGGGDILDPVDRALFARLNLAAGKHSVSASSYEQARGYFDAGISLLSAHPWEKQYSLCLELYEMAVTVSFMDGKIETVSSRLDVIISNARSFEDSLKSRALRARLLASQEQYSDATNEVLEILSKLGEDFPPDSSLSDVTSELKTMRPLLNETTKETILHLPEMTDGRKLNAMKFMSLLISFGHFSQPLLVQLISCRMVKMSFECGQCKDTIIGLAFVAFALLKYSDDIDLASHLGRITESLMEGHPDEHYLRANLTQPTVCVRCFTQPFQATGDACLSGYRSANIVGDVDNAIHCRMMYCICNAVSLSDLIGLRKYLVDLLNQMAKHNRIGPLRSAVSYLDTVNSLIGDETSSIIDSRVETKTNKELYEIALQTQSTYLLHFTIVNQMYVHCFFREHVSVSELAPKYPMGSGVKRVLDFYFCFFQGISALWLARNTKQTKWRTIGEQSVRTMTQLVQYSTWNFENKYALLSAELHYLNNRRTMAELSYQMAITSARDHRFYHEEALACELYGIYLVENDEVGRGLEQLQMAMEKYKQWGAAKKADAVKEFMAVIGGPVHFWGKTFS